METTQDNNSSKRQGEMRSIYLRRFDYRMSQFWRYTISIALVVLVTLISLPIHLILEPTNLVMLFLAVVVLSAIYLGRGPAILASILSVLFFDYFLIEPRFSLNVHDTQYLITFLGLLVVGLIISTTAATLRNQLEILDRRERHTAALNSLSRDLTGALKLDEMLASVIRHVSETFGLQASIRLPEGPQNPAQPGVYSMPLKTVHGVVGTMDIWQEAKPGNLTQEQRQLLEGFANLAALAIERAKLAEQARQAQILQTTERLQSALLSSISHELRTPLVSITGALSTLAEATQPESSTPMEWSVWQELVDTAYGEAQRMNLLVSNLLNMTRLEAGAFQLILEPCDIQDLVGIALARYTERRYPLALKVSIEEDLPLVQVDVSLMAQVLVNLLDNAAKYSPEGTTLEIQARPHADGVLLSVTDRGSGILPEHLDRIFDKFFRSKQQDTSGTGLGLSISKGIVEAHGGRIWAENRPGGGTLIQIILPFANGKEHPS
jgi:two-component system sensor histidine kinase KdpD